MLRRVRIPAIVTGAIFRHGVGLERLHPRHLGHRLADGPAGPRAPRRLSRLHPTHGTPYLSTATATGLIVTLIVALITLLGEHGLAGPISVGFEASLVGLTLSIEEFSLGLSALNGFAVLNLLLPLAVVNGALIYSRRRYPDIERGFRVPGVPVVPILGIVANVALIYNLPPVGIAVGLIVSVILVLAYLVWGGAPDVEDLFERVTEPTTVTSANGGHSEGDESDDRFHILVPVARPDRAPTHVRLAAALGRFVEGEPFVHVINITRIPKQTPKEIVTDDAEKRAERLTDTLAAADIDADYTVEGHI